MCFGRDRAFIASGHSGLPMVLQHHEVREAATFGGFVELWRRGATAPPAVTLGHATCYSGRSLYLDE